MANTFKKIQTVTVGSGGAASIDFTSIPQTYTDLKIVVSLRTNSAGSEAVMIEFNGSSSNLSGRRLYGDGGSATSDTLTNIRFAINTAADTASVFSNGEFYIPNYTSANNKSVSVDGVNETNGTNAVQSLVAGLWSNTAAITSIKLLGNSSGSFVQYSTATLYGVSNVPAAGNAKATGGIITYDNTYVYHTFPWSGTFTPLTSLTCDYLIVAGGGGGGYAFAGAGGGGGAGGYKNGSTSVTATNYTITVGAAGSRAPNGSTKGITGGTSSAFSLTADGGGGGGSAPSTPAGANGASGGGASGDNAASGGTGISGQGFAGGSSNGVGGGAGGGGMSAAGTAGSTVSGAAGGNGLSTWSAWLAAVGIGQNSSGTWYVGGGGGGGAYTGGAGSGGLGGGGTGATDGTTAGAGTANSGGGGGGQNRNFVGGGGGNGGSGVVIVRYTV